MRDEVLALAEGFAALRAVKRLLARVLLVVRHQVLLPREALKKKRTI